MRRRRIGWTNPFVLIDWASSSSLASLKRSLGWSGLGSIRSISTSRSSSPSIVASESRALSPRPSAFLAIFYHLFRQVHITFCPTRFDIIKNDRLPMTRSLRQPDISRNDGIENLSAEKVPQIGNDLVR